MRLIGTRRPLIADPTPSRVQAVAMLAGVRLVRPPALPVPPPAGSERVERSLLKGTR